MSQAYYAEARPEIQVLIRAPGARVLDVGCGEGALAAALKAAGAAYVAGIEIHTQAAAVARSRLDCVVEGSVLDVALPFASADFDYLIFADVLEHLPDPDIVLKRCLPFLRRDGRVVISVPNWRFYSVLWRLLVDRWEYTDAGVRDRTHLRVFTRYSVEQLLERHRLHPEEIHRNVRLIEDQSEIGRLAAAATRISNATLALSPLREFLTYQYVVVAQLVDDT